MSDPCVELRVCVVSVPPHFFWTSQSFYTFRCVGFLEASSAEVPPQEGHTFYFFIFLALFFAFTAVALIFIAWAKLSSSIPCPSLGVVSMHCVQTMSQSRSKQKTACRLSFPLSLEHVVRIKCPTFVRLHRDPNPHHHPKDQVAWLPPEPLWHMSFSSWLAIHELIRVSRQRHIRSESRYYSRPRFEDTHGFLVEKY